MRFHLSPILSTVLLVTACGQDPSFLEKESKSADATGSAVDTSGDPNGSGGSVDENGIPRDPADGTTGNSTDQTDPNGGTPTVDGTGNGNEVLLPGGGSNDWMPDWVDKDNPEPLPGDGNEVDPGDTGAGNPPVIPGAEPGDLDALHKCLAKWRNNPFKGTVNNFERISASVSVGGFGNPVNDTENTDEPFLILIDAGVNVGGAPTYNLMNRNGYYCMKVNVNVVTDFNINLHCNARLADSKVNVNVGSTQNDSTSSVGVHVLSKVQVNTIKPEGDRCIR